MNGVVGPIPAVPYPDFVERVRELVQNKLNKLKEEDYMSLAKFNKGSNKVEWGINTDGLVWVKVQELKEWQDYPFLGCFIISDTKGYGESVGIISCNIDEPSKETQHIIVRTTSTFVDEAKSILADQEAVDQIKLGHEKFSMRKFTNKAGQTGYSVVLK